MIREYSLENFPCLRRLALRDQCLCQMGLHLRAVRRLPGSTPERARSGLRIAGAKLNQAERIDNGSRSRIG